MIDHISRIVGDGIRIQRTLVAPRGACGSAESGKRDTIEKEAKSRFRSQETHMPKIMPLEELQEQVTEQLAFHNRPWNARLKATHNNSDAESELAR